MTDTELPPMEVAARGVRLRDRMADAGCDALVVTHLTSIRYLTGFTGSNARLVVDGAGLLLITDGRYAEQAADQLAAARVEAELELARTAELERDVVTARLGATGRIGLEAEHVSWGAQRGYARDWFPDVELVPTSGLVEGLRATKDAGEVARIEAACRIADDALDAVLPLLDEQPSEVRFAQALEDEMRRRGANGISFATIVAAGPNGSRPHHEPSDRAIGHGELLVVDFGAIVEGYHSDMTRTVPVGGIEALDGTQRRMLAVVTAAQAAGVAAVRAGVPVGEVDAACREVIAEAGWGDAFMHGVGHGVGLDIHEAPGMSVTSDATLADGHVVTVEPGVYLPGHGGVRVEDTVVVTAGGCRTLTCAPKSHP